GGTSCWFVAERNSHLRAWRQRLTHARWSTPHEVWLGTRSARKTPSHWPPSRRKCTASSKRCSVLLWREPRDPVQASFLSFLTQGCWEVTAQIGDLEESKLTFVTRVVKIGDALPGR